VFFWFQELPLLFLKGGSIIPTGPVIQSTTEFGLSNDLVLIMALDENGKFPLFNIFMFDD
jgi:alpha-glucosidase